MIEIIEYILNAIGIRKLLDMLDDLKIVEKLGRIILKFSEWITNLIRSNIIYCVIIIAVALFILVGTICSHIYNKPYSTYRRKKKSTPDGQNTP